MRKYFNEEGKEVKFGDTVSVKEKQIMPEFGDMVIVSSVIFRKEIATALEAAGWITHRDTFEITETAVLNRIAKSINCSLSNTIKTLTVFIGNNTDIVVHLAAMAIFNILYKDRYSDILNKEEVFGLDKFNSNEIINLGKPSVKYLGIIAMFKSREEAEEASKLVQSVIKYLNDRK